MYDLEKLRREEFPLSADLLYFNHASVSPLPQRTRRKILWVIEQLTHSPSDFWFEPGAKIFPEFDARVAAFINAASPSEVVPVFNTSLGFNLFAQSLDFQAGENVAFCDVEFPSNAYPWMSLEQDGVDVRQVPAVDGGLTLAALEPLVDDRTRVVAASAIQFFTGHRTDLAAIGAFCRERGILFAVDAMQASGHLKIDVQAMQIDVLVTGGQKSLLTLPAVGFMYVRDAVAERLNSRFISATSTQNWEAWMVYETAPLPGADRFKTSTQNKPGMFALVESLGLLEELGLEQIDRHTCDLVTDAIRRMDALGYPSITALNAHGPIATFDLGMSDAEADGLMAYLHEQRVCVVKHLSSDGRPHLRLSFHCYNTREELDQFEAIIRKYTS